MGKMRILGLAGLVLAGGMISGCWGDNCWCGGGGSKTTLPQASQNPAPTTGVIQQPATTGWNDKPATPATRPPVTQEPIVSNPISRTPVSADTGAAVRSPSTSNIQQMGASQVDSGMVANPNPVRTVTPVSSISEGVSSTRLPLPPPTPPVNQRDLVPQGSTVLAPTPPVGSMPPPPPPLPPVAPTSSNTSRYQTLPPTTQGELPPLEPIPGQSKIPVLKNGSSIVE